jgi:predicted transporter
MGILLAFAPFIEFVVLDELLGSTEGLLAGIIMSAGLLIRDLMSADREPKIIEIGTAIFFCGLAVQALLLDPAWSIDGVRLRVDSGLLIMILVTLAIRQPFTLQYAREQVAPEFWESPEFVRANYVITAMWALAFSVVVIVELILLQWPEVPPRVGILVTIAALVGAVKFTSWYPEHRRAMLSKTIK